MLKSMTAYGRASLISSLGHFSIEIQSVNRKHLEINTVLPKEFLRFDAEIKRWISMVVGRGQVNVRINVSFEQTTPLKVIPNLALAHQIKQAWNDLASALQVTIDDSSLIRVLSNQSEILLYDDDLQHETEYKNVLKELVDQALIHLVAMKTKEGASLLDDMMGRLGVLSKTIKCIAEKAPGATVRYQEKLKERVQEALGASIENEERILREVCVYADKIDIAEELTRFDSHLSQMHQLLQSKQAVGKTLEFLIQELNREINTIGSKSSDVDVSRFVIEIKTELERIREQIQNIE
jgi:uncharacterized protein (TIGR00255 family)